MYGAKLSIVCAGSRGDEILNEDLTGIQSDPVVVKQYYGAISQLCRTNNKMGIAANQVGLRENFFFAAKTVNLLPSPYGVLVINPTWKPHKNGKQYDAKGEDCLSLPNPSGIGMRKFNVPRWSKIVASWIDSAGTRVKPRLLSGIAAQVFQHEVDHLRGILLTDVGTEIKIH